MLVDDDLDTLLCFSILLKSLGHQLSTAPTGADALAELRGHATDVVVCDLSLTEEMSGLDLARFLREDPALQRIPIIALTGHGSYRDRQATAAAGFVAHIVKPLELSELQAVLSGLGSGATSRV
jgi:CheY-like chemotaxis protein